MYGLQEKKMSDDARNATVIIGTDHREIKLTQGKVAIVDAEDFEELNKFKWYATQNTREIFYARRTARIDGKNVQVYMHRMILNPQNSLETDHVNRDGLDNRRSNLRCVTRRANCFNRRLNRRNKSGCTGIRTFKNSKRCEAWVGNEYLGSFKTIEAATKRREDCLIEMGVMTS